MYVLKTGWLAPDGSMYQCSSYKHDDLAEQIVKKFNYINPVMTPDDILINKGWCRIRKSIMNNGRYNIVWQGFLTEYQKQFLKECLDNDENCLDELTLILLKREME